MINIEDRINDRGVKVIDYKDYKGKFLYDDKLDEFFENLEEVRKRYKIQPQYMYGTYYRSIKINLYNLLEYVCEDLAEGTIDCLIGVEELQEAVDKFNKLNEENGTYYEDNHVIVRLPRE